MPNITPEQRPFVEKAVDRFTHRLNSFNRTLRSEMTLGGRLYYSNSTEEIADLEYHFNRIQDRVFPTSSTMVEIDDSDVPCLKCILLIYRRDLASEVEILKEKTFHKEILDALDGKLIQLNNLMQQDWLLKAEPTKFPRLADHLATQWIDTIQRGNATAVHPEYSETFRIPQPFGQFGQPYNCFFTQLLEQTQQRQATVVPREYDEKFHILQSPRQFRRDLQYWRSICEVRGISVVVAYIDIDDFKPKFNGEHGEDKIDRLVLPRFMKALEAQVFAHGYAYRYGGDEYVLLLPNLTYELAECFLDNLRRNLADIQYPEGIKERTTVSIGFCYVEPDCPLTDREIEERANKAKNYAKKPGGKNCIATYSGTQFDPDSLHIIKGRRESQN